MTFWFLAFLLYKFLLYQLPCVWKTPYNFEMDAREVFV